VALESFSKFGNDGHDGRQGVVKGMQRQCRLLFAAWPLSDSCDVLGSICIMTC
jgi:hypothetical protein